MTLDLDTTEGQQELSTMSKNAAVLLEDWGPGIAKQRNLDYHPIAEENPGLVYFSLSAFGEKGPLRNLPG